EAISLLNIRQPRASPDTGPAGRSRRIPVSLPPVPEVRFPLPDDGALFPQDHFYCAPPPLSLCRRLCLSEVLFPSGMLPGAPAFPFPHVRFRFSVKWQEHHKNRPHRRCRFPCIFFLSVPGLSKPLHRGSRGSHEPPGEGTRTLP